MFCKLVLRGFVASLLVAASLGWPEVGAETERNQVLQLKAGWNAVLLEVEPLDRKSDTAFAGTPIDIAARYFANSPAVTFITDPNDAPWKQPGWGVWYSPDRPDAFLSTLHAVQGNVAYLIHSKADFTWKVRGAALLARPAWKAESFNFVGFSIDPQNPPTFSGFFSGTGGLIGKEIYRLTDGKWILLTNPQGTYMRSGEAFWVSCAGRTDFEGTVSVAVPGVGELDFGTTTDELEISVKNTSGRLADLRVETVTRSAGLPLRQVTRDLSAAKRQVSELPTIVEFPAVPAGQERKLRLQVRREQLGAGTQSALLRISSSEGGHKWVPVQARSRGIAQQ